MARSNFGDPFGARCVQVRALQLGRRQHYCSAAVAVELLSRLLPDDESTHTTY